MHLSSRIVTIFAVFVVIVLSFVIFSASMSKPVIDNEHMHCAAGILLSQGKMIYKDFSYPGQMPYLPLLYAALFKVSNNTYYLLTARIFSVFCNMLTMVCIVGVYRRIFTDHKSLGTLLALAAATLYSLNPLVSRASGFAWNIDAVIACIMLAFCLFININFQSKPSCRSIALIGGLLTLASCMRTTTVLIQLLFFVMLLAMPAKSAKVRLKTILPFLISTAIILIWPIWTLLAAPRAFFLNLFSLPLYYAALIKKLGVVFGKFDLSFILLTIPGGILIILMAGFFVIALVRHRYKITITTPANLILAVLLVLTSLVTVLIQPKIWMESFAMPIPFLIICFAFALLYLKKLGSNKNLNKSFRIGCLLLTACAITSVAVSLSLLVSFPGIFKPQNWVPVQAHNVSLDIARKSKSRKPIPTLAPIYALEAGKGIYPELSAGPFVYAIAAALSPEELKSINAISPKGFKQLLQRTHPSVVIVHANVRFIEKALIRIAKRNWPQQYYDKEIWERKAYDYGLVVYFRRDEYYRQ